MLLLVTFLDFTCTNIKKGIGEDHFKIYRYIIQIWTWSFPTRSRKKELHGTSQERQTKCSGSINCTLPITINPSQIINVFSSY